MDTALKNMYNLESVTFLGEVVQGVYADFDRAAFVDLVFDQSWENLELKQRMRQITLALGACLPAEYAAALTILRQALPHLADQGFEKMVFPDFVEVFGQDHYELSMAALELFTRHISAELAVRPFIARYPEKAMGQMLAWTGHAHEAVRRLASEGCRPRLPWAMALPALKQDPSPILPILEKLKNDPSDSVRRSVANNLNDISKDNPQVVIETLQRWQVDGSQAIAALTRHALRTLLKAGQPQALALLGFEPRPAVTVSPLQLSSTQVPLGGRVSFSFTITSKDHQTQELMIDYVVHLVRANGRRTSKVFKLSKRQLAPGESIELHRAHSFRPVTTRTYYPGLHTIQPQINGQLFAGADFHLGDPEL
jgi:3-methyladenine DNA glycosylase AlkC